MLEPPVFNPPQIAKRWACKPDSVRRLLEVGVLRGFHVSPPGTLRPRWRVTLDALLAYESGERPVIEQPKQRRQKAG